MADATEDLLFSPTSTHKPPLNTKHNDHEHNHAIPSHAPSDSDSEAGDSDTAPDYSTFLASLSTPATATSSFLAQASTTSTLPKRGTKDFEPHPTTLQTSSLQRSRDAMAQTLTYTRVHAPKVHVRGVYDGTTGLTRVSRVRGQMFARLGRNVSGGDVELWPEEALWGLERGALDVVWGLCDKGEGVYATPEGTPVPEDRVGDGAEKDYQKEDNESGLPMSLQAAYAAYVGGDWGLTAEKYVVYAGLKRAGFVVLRAEGFQGVRRRRKCMAATRDDHEQKSDEDRRGAGLWAWLQSFLAESETTKNKRLASGPLVRPGLYRSYNDIYSMLRIIPSYRPPPTTQTAPSSNVQTAPLPIGETTLRPSNTQQADLNSDEPELNDDDYEETITPYTTTFNIHRPLPNFRKSAPGKPDFRVCVVSARDTRVPTLTELDELLAEQPSDPPPPAFQPAQPSDPAPSQQQQSTARGGRGGRVGGRGRGFGIGGVYNRIKHGQRNVLLAVVDEGVVSYMRVCEAGFAEERLYEKVGPPAGRGGKGGGRGRGGPRGGRGGRGRGG